MAPCAKAALASQNVFLALGDLPKSGAPRTLDVEVTRDGKTLASEEFHLPADLAGDLELFSRHPQLLERIAQVAEKEGRSVGVTLRLDGTVVREMAFQDLTAADRQRTKGGLSPLSLPSRVVDPSAPVTPPARSHSTRLPAGSALSAITAKSSPDPECAQACYDEWGYCGSIEQVGCDCYPHCIDNCLNNCPHDCTEPAYQSERTEVQIVNAQWIDYHCYEDPWEWDFYDGHYYDVYYVTYKISRIRTTLHCDGSSTEEVVSVSYSNAYCSYRYPFNTCHYPFGPTMYPPSFC